MSRSALIAGVEAGGTKMIVGLGSPDWGSIVTASVPTGDPDATMAEIAAFFARERRDRDIAAVGIASFGPVDLDQRSPTYGHILDTPKRAWAGFDLLGGVRAMLDNVPGGIDTDVNAAALAEAEHGAGEGTQDLAYVTIGTGIGVGLLVNGALVHGAAHPEGGHIRPRRHPAHADFAGICPFHHDCLEGLASGPAVRAAWGAGLDELPADHVAWEVEADYCAQLAALLILTNAPVKIVFGGGVMRQQALFAAMRDRTAALLAGYGRGTDRAALESRIVPSGCREAPGLIGAYMLGSRALA